MAKVTLYFIPELQYSKNRAITYDSYPQLLDFLSDKPSYTMPNDYIGWIKDENSIEQMITIPKNLYKNYNYVSIANELPVYNDNPYYYYYVVDVNELGNDQFELKLMMDTINTYITLPTNPAINVENKKSLVLREHKPRFDLEGNPIYDTTKESADNTTPQIIRSQVIEGNGRVRFAYRNRSSDWRPVAYIYSETGEEVSYTGDDSVVSIGNIGEKGYSYVWDGDFKYGTGEGLPSINVSANRALYFFAATYNYNGGPSIITRHNKSSGTVDSTIFNSPENVNLKIRVGTTLDNELYLHQGTIDNWSYMQTNHDLLNNAPSGVTNLPKFDMIDPLDPLNQKIVEVPYLSKNMNFKKDGLGVYVEITDVNDFFDLITPLPIAKHSISPSGWTFDTSKVEKPKVPFNDPKLYTSQFAPVFITNHGSSIGIKRESIHDFDDLKWNLVTPLSDPSNFGLEIISYNSNKTEIDELLASYSVNNEVVTIKDEGYTFNEFYKDLDDKARKITERAAYRNQVLDTVNQVFGITGGMIGGVEKGINPAVAAGRIASAGISIFQGWKNYKDQQKLTDISYEQKYINMLLQSSIISGSSLDFLRSNGIDKLRVIHFGLSNKQLQFWDEYFHRFGYQTLEYKKINLKTRKYFNYIQAELEEDILYPIMNEDIKNDIKRRFREGVTFYHINDDTIDFDQEKENWEV